MVGRPLPGPIETERGFPEPPFIVVLASGKKGHIIAWERHRYQTFSVETDTVGFVRIEVSVVEAPPLTPYGRIVGTPGSNVQKKGAVTSTGTQGALT